LTKLKRKIKISILSCIVSISKIIITSIFLFFNEIKCDLPLENWLYLMILNESIQLICCFFECHKYLNVLQTNNFNNVALNDSFDSNFFNPDYVFNERNHQTCNNFFFVKELNKMFSFNLS